MKPILYTCIAVLFYALGNVITEQRLKSYTQFGIMMYCYVPMLALTFALTLTLALAFALAFAFVLTATMGDGGTLRSARTGSAGRDERTPAASIPAESATALVMPVTGTGVNESVRLPLPS